MLPIRAPDHGHQFCDLFALVGLVTARDGVLDAVRHVIPQYLLLDTPQRGPDGGDLGDDVDAVTILINHS